MPVALPSPDQAIVGGLRKYRLAAQVDDDLPVGRVVSLLQKTLKPRKEQSPVDAHKKALDVQLEDPRLPGVVGGLPVDETVHAVDPEVGAPAGSTGIAVVDELLLEKVVYLVDDQMVDDAVAEVGSVGGTVFFVRTDVLRSTVRSTGAGYRIGRVYLPCSTPKARESRPSRLQDRRTRRQLHQAARRHGTHGRSLLLPQ